jgi:RNA polymerase sigma factor (sigma-70 family)
VTTAIIDIAPKSTELVIRARNGDEEAWPALVERYSPLVWSICRRYGLSPADAEDVGQTVWLRLFNQLDALCEPAALAGWLSTTVGRECARVRRVNGRLGPGPAGPGGDVEGIPDQRARSADHALLAAERDAAVRAAFTRLPAGCQDLLTLLIADPPVPYAEISGRLGLSVGTIGPGRRRCLNRLRRDPVIAALLRETGVALDE